MEPILEVVVEKKICPIGKLLLHNDDVNDFIYVVVCLSEIFSFEARKSGEIAEEANDTGVALLEATNKEKAELRMAQLRSCTQFSPGGIISTFEEET